MISPSAQHAFQAPTGTRDFYPAELARLRYIQDAWRRTSINHGFEEIDGPTFEHLELYTVKSGEGIVSELFSFERFGGEKKFALRPEFTPTLARLYAARANALPKPTKWFWQQNCFRAERPQRGRLREFCQWNCDIIGGEPSAQAEADAEVIACAVGMFESLGLQSGLGREFKDGAWHDLGHLVVRISDRTVLSAILSRCGIAPEQFQRATEVIDERTKVPPPDFAHACKSIGLDIGEFDRLCALATDALFYSQGGPYPGQGEAARAQLRDLGIDVQTLWTLFDALEKVGYRDWCVFDPRIVRGLAYYTGMVFEVHEASGAERAIAGGGRYDKLIEMFGGPPTPAVGFGLGDVVLSLVLQDKGLFPTDDQIADRLGLRPDVFVISNGQPEADATVAPALAQLRRAGLHARRTYKTTKNVGKLIGEAVKARARFALIVESAAAGQLKNLETQAQEPVQLADVAARVKR